MALGTAGKPSTAGKPQVVKNKSNGTGARISSRPSDAVSGGGAPDNVDVTILECRAVSDFDYNGTQEPCPALYVKMKDNQSGNEYEQNYTAGKLNRLVADDSGEYFVPAEGSSAAGMITGCNAFMFLAALTDKGFPEDKLDNFSTLVGLSGHMNAVAPKSRGEGVSNKPVAIFTKIHKMPWETVGKAGGASQGKSSTQPSTVSETNGGGDDDSVEAVASFLRTNGGTFSRKQLGISVFKNNPKMEQKARTMLLQTLQKDAFFADHEDRFINDGENVTLIE